MLVTMVGGRIEAFLKLFCITESSHGSWQSWTVLCICLVSAIATASSGSYFHRTNAVKSSLICYIVSTAGFSMSLVTLIAILIGCKRRRRIIDPEAPHGEPTMYANPIRSEQSTSIEIEEDPSESSSVEQMWMNPVFAEYDKSLYEADWNKKDYERRGKEDNDTYFIERDSDCFRSSLETMTWSNRSYSEDEGYFQHSSNESDLKEAGKSHRKSLSMFKETLKFNSKQATSSDLKEADVSSLKSHKDQNSMSQKELKDSSVHSLKKSTIRGSAFKQHFSNGPRISEFDGFQVSQNLKSRRVFQNCSRNSSSSISCFEAEIISNDNLTFVKNYGLHLYYDNEPETDFLDNENVAYIHDGTLPSAASRLFSDNGVVNEGHNGKRLINAQESRNGYVTPTFIRRDELTNRFEENENSKYLMHNKVSKSSQQSDECHILSNSAGDLSTIVKVEDYTKSTESSIRENSLTIQNVLESTLSQEARPTINEMSHSILSHQEKLEQKRHSINRFDYPSLPYPIFNEDYSNFENLEREEFFIPRYVKRPLLDVNGEPISQKELVKVITRLLISGLPNIPKSTSKCEVLK